MLELLKPVRSDSLKEICVARLEELILSGAVKVGEKLAPERDLAQQLGVSRPIVHEALVDLAAKGLVSIVPRVGTVVSDYTREGSLALLTSLINYRHGALDAKMLEGLLRMRMLFETENARQAAANRTLEQMEAFYRIAFEESEADFENLEQLTRIDFEFHLLVAMATGNLLYPMMLNSFKPVYTNISRLFFSDPAVVAPVFLFHRQLISTLSDRDEEQAAMVMYNLLKHGEIWAKTNLSSQGGPR